RLPQAIDLGNSSNPQKVKNSCFTTELYDSYVRHGRRQGVSRRAIEVKIGMFLTKMVGSNLKKERADNDSRDPYYVFPPLEDCRKRFAGKMRNDNLEWDDWQDWDHSSTLFAEPAWRF